MTYWCTASVSDVLYYLFIIISGTEIVIKDNILIDVPLQPFLWGSANTAHAACLLNEPTKGAKLCLWENESDIEQWDTGSFPQKAVG